MYTYLGFRDEHTSKIEKLLEKIGVVFEREGVKLGLIVYKFNSDDRYKVYDMLDDYGFPYKVLNNLYW